MYSLCDINRSTVIYGVFALPYKDIMCLEGRVFDAKPFEVDLGRGADHIYIYIYVYVYVYVYHLYVSLRKAEVSNALLPFQRGVPGPCLLGARARPRRGDEAPRARLRPWPEGGGSSVHRGIFPPVKTLKPSVWQFQELSKRLRGVLPCLAPALVGALVEVDDQLDPGLAAFCPGKRTSQTSRAEITTQDRTE